MKLLHDYNNNGLKTAGLDGKSGGRPIPDLDTGVVVVSADTVDNVLTALGVK